MKKRGKQLVALEKKTNFVVSVFLLIKGVLLKFF
jgi:hypothetical protein